MCIFSWSSKSAALKTVTLSPYCFTSWLDKSSTCFVSQFGYTQKGLHSIIKISIFNPSLFFIINYKWANIEIYKKSPHHPKNIFQWCTIFNKNMKIAESFYPDLILKILISIFKSAVFSRMHTAHVMNQWHDQPVSLNSLLRTRAGIYPEQAYFWSVGKTIQKQRCSIRMCF